MTEPRKGIVQMVRAEMIRHPAEVAEAAAETVSETLVSVAQDADDATATQAVPQVVRGAIVGAPHVGGVTSETP